MGPFRVAERQLSRRRPSGRAAGLVGRGRGHIRLGALRRQRRRDDRAKQARLVEEFAVPCVQRRLPWHQDQRAAILEAHISRADQKIVGVGVNDPRQGFHRAGGDDHAVMHLIYARFWTKVMRDMELVPFNEPFKRLLTQGMVVGETFFDDSTGKRVYFPADQVTVERDAKGRITSARVSEPGAVATGSPKSLKHAIERMSKSKGNGVDPDEMVEIYGADATRLFIMFAAPIENELVWNEAGIEGAVRFLQRVWRQLSKWKDALGVPPLGGGPAEAGTQNAPKLRQKTHQTIKRVGDAFETLQFNTPVAALMELSNEIADIEPDGATDDEVAAVREALTALTLMLTPFAPHTAEELYSVLIGNENGMLATGARFPEYSEELAKADEIEIPVQINGKLRHRLLASPDATNEELEQMALSDEKVREYTRGKEIVKIVVVPKRLVNIVVK